MYIRTLFEANKHVSEPRQQRVCLSRGLRTDYTDIAAGAFPGGRGFARQMEAPRTVSTSYCSRRYELLRHILLDATRIINNALGSKFERNIPPPILDRE